MNLHALLVGPTGLGAAELGALFLHFMLLSLLAVGGAITTVPDMHRFVVAERHWLDDGQFTASVALAQAAPGPNVLFVAVIGWNIAGLPGMLATMTGCLLPSTTLALAATRWGHANREAIAMRAFSAGLAPLTIGLLLATGWVLTEPTRGHPAAVALVLGTAALMLKTKSSPLLPIAVGAVVGGLGWVG